MKRDGSKRSQSPDDDPLAGAFPVRRNVPAFLFSTAFHGVLFVLLAGFSMTVVANAPIKVTLRAPVQPLDELMNQEDFEGAPSLKDIAGTLRPVLTQPRTASAVKGPSKGPAVAGVRAPTMPRIQGVIPKIGAAPGTLDVPLSIGSGLAGAKFGGGGFGGMMGGLRKIGIDLAIVIDTTGSMQSVLDEVKAEVRDFIASLQEMVPASRVGVVAYRDRGEEYVVRWVDFSFHTSKVQAFVAGLRADGGGDYEEAVRQGMESAIDELSWRKSARRILILVGGTPPHREERGALLQVVREFHQQHDGAVGAIDVTKRLHEEYDRADWIAHGKRGPLVISPMPGFYRETTEAYREITSQAGGELLQLGQERALLRQVMILTFGTRWKSELKQFMGRL